MAVPLFWKQPTYLYAIGNTPAHSVAQYLEPEDPAKILLLGCGDARNVLYTVYATDADSPNNNRVLDFTCNDTEPAVLARNALLYSLLKDDPALEHIDQIWSIYYDMKLNDGAISLLHAQCAKLHAASASLDAWAASPYAAYMRFATEHTLQELHRLFGLFHSASTGPKLAQLTSAFKTGMAQKLAETHRKMGAGRNSVVLTALRAAGPLWLQLGIELAGALHERYWTTGVTTADTDSSAAKHANPTLAFALSGESFPPHGISLPCVGFHLAEAAAVGPREAATVQDVYAVCRRQFRAWCEAFAKAERVIVRFCVGDAFALCRALGRGNSRGIFAAQWKNTPLELLDGVPRRFTAVDTSNLVDALGLLNVLLLATPLLAETERAVLYTETLCASSGDAIKSLRTALCGELSTMALLLGVAPAGYLDSLVSHSHAHQIMFSRTNRNAECAGHERHVWRRIPSNALLAFEPAELGQLLVDVHYELFQSEDAVALRAKLIAAGVQAGKPVPLSLSRMMSNITYVRATFVQLLVQLRARLHCTVAQWNTVVNTILDRAGGDERLMIGDCSYQDLCLHLQASGLAAGVVPHHSLVPGYPHIDVNAGPFAKWPREKVGRLVWASLRIPVAAFDVLKGIDPVHELFFATRTPSALNYFATFSTFRGTVTPSPTPGAAFAVQPAQPDEAQAEVVAVALVPAWLVMFDPRATTLSITVRPGSLNGQKLMDKLGHKFEVFGASVLDKRNAFFASESDPPRVAGVPLAPLYDTTSRSDTSKSSSTPVVSVALDAQKANVATMMLRADVETEEERAQWGAKVDVKAVQLSPVEAEVRTVCGTFRQRLCFPLPVDVQNARVRVARKSFYVEVVAPLAQTVAYSVQSMRGLFHNVNLDRLPILDTARHTPQWLDMHGQFAFSDRERADRDAHLNRTERGLPHVDVKDDIFTLLMRSAGLLQNPVRVFCLIDDSRPGATPTEKVYAFIFVKALRLDGPGNTVVADAYVLPGERASTTPNVMAGALQHPAAMAALWSRLLVGFAERCRNWSHKSSCARPVDRLCGCGAGADVGGFKAVGEWMCSGARAEDVTRVAISFPCAPHFVENVGGHMPNFGRMGEAGASAAAARGPSVPTSGYGLASSTRGVATVSADRDAVHVPAVVEEPAGQCGRCGNEARLACAKCAKVKYCNKNCMRMHAKVHKSSCK